MASDNVISFENSAPGARQRMAEGRLQKLVAMMRAQAAETLPQLAQDLFEHLDDALYELADKSSSDALETQYFEAMRELRKLREPITNQYVGNCLNGYDQFWEGRSLLAQSESEQPLDEDELSLVADEDLEEDLAITSMVSKAENRFHRELFALNMRFGAVRGGDVVDSENPLGPRRIGENFAQSLQQWQGDTAVRLLVFKLFDRYVMGFVGGLYDEINDTLVSADVLPRIVQRARRNPVAPSVQRSRDPQQLPTADQASENSNELLGLLGQLLAAQRQNDSGDAAAPALRPTFSLAGSVAGHLPEVSTDHLLQALSGLQMNALNRAPVDVDEAQALQVDLAQSLGQALEMGSTERPLKRLGRADQDVFDVVGLLFDFILDDKNLPEAMKALLGRLQIPMLKVAVSDRSFFSNRQHPARVLLNNLARAAVAWSDDGDRSASSAYGYIESAINQVLSDYADDLSVFEQVNEQFSAYIERERRSAEVAEERVGQVKRGQEQLEVARSRVREVIDAYVDGCEPPECQVPDAVMGMLNEGWSDVLLLAYLREGEQSESWRNACQIVEDLLWSVQPKVAQPERQALLKAIPDLLKRVRQGLVNISFDQHRSATLFKELQACHIAALRGARVESKATAVATEVPAVGIVEAALPKVEDDFSRQASELKVGQWMEWQLDETHWQRGKLSWRSEVSDSFIFVSRKGVKVAELKRAEIAAWLRESRAQVLADADKPLMDRALDAMVEALQKTAQPAT